MRKKELKFSEDRDVRVRLKLECFDSDIHASLKISDNKFPKLEFDSLSGISFGSVRLSEEEKKFLTCKSETFSYSLLGNEVLADDIWSRYLIQGEAREDVCGVEVLVSGVSEWIDQETYFDITETEIKKERPVSLFDEKLDIDGNRFQIKSNYNCTVENNANRDFLISESTTIVLVNLEETIEIEYAEKLAHRIESLFSLLLASPLSIECVWLVGKEGKNRSPFYFSTPSKNLVPYNNARECFIHPVRVSKDIGWKVIFENYFCSENSATFGNIWSRIPSLLSYSGTWDYEILGYVSILDSYCNECSAKNGRKLNRTHYQSIKSDLLSVVDKYLDDLGDEYSEVLSSFKAGIGGIRNTNLPTFREKYDFMIERIDPGISQVVKFTTDEFSIIKGIRDSAAHGLPIETRNGRDISYEFRLKDRLLVLLIYLVYRDLGVNPVEFAKSLKYTLSRFVMNSGIDSTERDRLVGTVPFWEVDEISFSRAKESKKFYVGVKYDKSSNEYMFSASVTNECQAWLGRREPEERDLIEYVKKKLFNKVSAEIEFVSQAYLVYGEESVELSAVCKVSN